jgi:uncharacterized membrane protein SpoIIM required for sporulation
MLLTHSTDVNQFLQRKQLQWQRLEALLERVEATGLLSLTPAEIREFGVLYRRASSDLVSARAKTANAELLEYLNDLVARGYAQVYRTRRYKIRDVWSFIAFDFPRLFRHCFRSVALSTGISLAAALFGFIAGAQDPMAASYLLPPRMARDLPATRQQLRHTSGRDINVMQMAEMSGQILTNNIGVAFMAFAAGITFGVGTLLVLLFNGFMLGVFASALSHSDTAIVFWSLILPHGVIELTAIFIAGGAGLMVGMALLSPGQRTRRDALLERGRQAVLLLLGTIPMFVVAGLIEGFITPPWWIPPPAKLAFAALTLGGLIAYLGYAGRRAGAAGVEELTG